MHRNAKIYVAGHRGLVGSALVRALDRQGYKQIITRSKAQLDLRDAQAVDRFFEQEKPDYVFLAAAKVGGIAANDAYPADFIRDNLMIQTHVIEAAYRHQVQKLLFLGSTCIYPKLAPQPLQEHYLLTGELEATNEAYAIAKIAGIKMCQAYNRQYGTRFISAMPTNLYGPNDDFDLQASHVLPALIRKIDEAKELNTNVVEIWGSGAPRREFLYVDDLADACIFLMRFYEENDIINIGVGEDISIKDLALLIGEVVGYAGQFSFNKERPDGTPRKLVNVSKLTALGWKAETSLKAGIQATYDWYRQHRAGAAAR
ncbi:GDP-L-fucose synthase family protein [Paenibacillus senegalensis]|uniref:GDP-L-fucose synthase family protein n=1 Tax=Paenibacillus senegalensis TaxID=1465766 RepID=UPI000288B3C0|nr:GDP-L-fucose synthase [Paenibacillus senegalensis]